jgi:transposase
MKQMYFIGVDISKEKVDVALMDQSYQVLLEKVVKNDDLKIVSFLNQVVKKFKLSKDQLLVCCEETGIYKRPLQRACMEVEIDLWVELALKIKKASSAMRGKSDRQDAVRIADYACRYSDKKVIYKEPSQSNKTLHVMLNTRETINDSITRLKQQISESKRFDKEKYDIQKQFFLPALKALKKQLEQVEAGIDELIKSCCEMNRSLELLSSIPGIGRQTALQFIVYTRNFTLFQTAKHLACYAGVAPFPNESGMIIKRAKVSNLANKKLKSLLHLAAMACTKAKGDLRDYYIRKVQEGKNKMLVLNNLRNKLVIRMYAVINRGSKYISTKSEISLAS